MALATPQPARMRALNTLLGDRRPRGFLRRIDWWVGQLCSFEVMFTLFLYSNELKTIIPFPFPIDETVVFGGLCIPMMGYVAWREVYRSTVVRHRFALMRPWALGRADRSGPGPASCSRAAR